MNNCAIYINVKMWYAKNTQTFHNIIMKKYKKLTTVFVYSIDKNDIG